MDVSPLTLDQPITQDLPIQEVEPPAPKEDEIDLA